MSYFKIEEFLITGEMPEQEIVDKIQHHIDVMNPVREAYGKPITVSQRSGYRPVWWEKQRGRSGNSQHCFKGKGAADYTGSDLQELLKMLILHSSYTRICYYKKQNFIHCDFKPAKGGRRLYKAVGGRWQFVQNI